MVLCHWQENLVINMGNLWILQQKQEQMLQKLLLKRVVQKPAEATGDLIGNKIADKIILLGQTKSKEKEDERQEIYIPPEKRQQIIDDLRLF